MRLNLLCWQVVLPWESVNYAGDVYIAFSSDFNFVEFARFQSFRKAASVCHPACLRENQKVTFDSFHLSEAEVGYRSNEIFFPNFEGINFLRRLFTSLQVTPQGVPLSI